MAADEIQELIAAGNEALNAGRWQAAREAFEAALARGESAEASYGLGAVAWWQGDMLGAVANLETAYAGFRRRKDVVSAAGCAMRLGFHYHGHLANSAVAAGWLALAARLIEEHGLDALRGELPFTRAFLSEDPVAAEALAREALDAGRRGGDADLEVCARSQLGAALVRQGRVAEGIALLDEAMAACLGGEHRIDTVAFASCTMMTSCARCADFERAVQWMRAAERIVARHGSPYHSAECRTVHARVLFAIGEWDKSEEAARAAVRTSAGAMPILHADALAALAELRVAQGAIEEAQRLLVGHEGQPSTIPVSVRIHLARGEAALAAQTAERHLEAIGPSRLESALLLELLGDAEIAQGAREAAAERGRALAAFGASFGCDVVQARGERLAGRALGPADASATRRALDDALATFVRLGMPYEAARTRAMLAEVLREAAPQSAASEARTALSIFERLGAAPEADAAALLLRQLGVRAARVGPRTQATLTRREDEVLALLGEGLSNPEIARRLHVSRKTVEHHVAHVLGKLGLRSRAEAAAESVRRLARESASK